MSLRVSALQYCASFLHELKVVEASLHLKFKVYSVYKAQWPILVIEHPVQDCHVLMCLRSSAVKALWFSPRLPSRTVVKTWEGLEHAWSDTWKSNLQGLDSFAYVFDLPRKEFFLLFKGETTYDILGWDKACWSIKYAWWHDRRILIWPCSSSTGLQCIDDITFFIHPTGISLCQAFIATLFWSHVIIAGISGMPWELLLAKSIWRWTCDYCMRQDCRVIKSPIQISWVSMTHQIQN